MRRSFILLCDSEGKPWCFTILFNLDFLLRIFFTRILGTLKTSVTWVHKYTPSLSASMRVSVWSASPRYHIILFIWFQFNFSLVRNGLNIKPGLNLWAGSREKCNSMHGTCPLPTHTFFLKLHLHHSLSEGLVSRGRPVVLALSCAFRTPWRHEISSLTSLHNGSQKSLPLHPFISYGSRGHDLCDPRHVQSQLYMHSY